MICFWKNRAGILLLPFSLLYGIIVFLRNKMYDYGIFKSHKFRPHVISIGNMTVGGTGKTPLVIAAANMLISAGRSAAVISRGYGRSSKDMIVVSDGKGKIADAAESGDEPVMAAKRLPGIPIIVCRDRKNAARYADKKFRPDILILDDAFQHRKIKRDTEIVTIDASNPFGNGFLLPAGPCRDFKSRLKAADIIVITRADQSDSTALLQKKLRKYTKAPVFLSRHKPSGWISPEDMETLPLEYLENQPVFAFCGIGNPDAFFRTLKSCGVDLRGWLKYPDHYWFKKSDLETVKSAAEEKGALFLVTTEKDLVRLPHTNQNGIRFLALGIEIDFFEDKDHFSRLMNQKCEMNYAQ